jgi:small-conductance mechanosensitive channel
MRQKKRIGIALIPEIVLFLFLLFTTFNTYTRAQDDWRPPELQKMEARFQELRVQAQTLDQYEPDKFPDFKDLEKINQLVELHDFNKRKFDLLIGMYNVLEDEFFPFILKYYPQHPELKQQVFAKLQEYTGKQDKSILLLQETINTVALKIERLEKQIERIQVTARDKEIADERKEKTDLEKKEASISTKIFKLEQDLKSYAAILEDEEKKYRELKEKEAQQNKKIAEKKNEIAELQQKKAAAANDIERLIQQTFSRVREIRLNGLEIPRLNAVKTFIYLTSTAIQTLKKQIENAEKEILILKEQRQKELLEKLIKSVVVIAIALFVVFLLIGISRRVAKKIVTRVEESEKIEAQTKQRYQTVSSVILSFIKVLIWVMAVLWVLGELDIDYAPFLVAAGGVSLAIGFGAQSLVKDMVSGFFILMEEQLALGDVVEINGQTGTIEKISIRTIRFRALDGTVHIIPTGSISMISNQTYQWSRAVVQVGVSYDEDAQKVLSVLKNVCREMTEDPEWQELLLEEPLPQGILSFGDSAVNFRILAKTPPGQQWAVGRELHIRVKNAFDSESIEIPYNYINVVNRTEKKEEPASGQKPF